MNAFCKGCGFCSVPNPSSVTIGSSPTSRTAIEQVLVSFPPTDAAQAPHCPRPQPNFGPFNPRSFRSTYNSGVSAAAVTTWDPPFTVSRYVILHPRSWRQSGGRAPSRLAQRDSGRPDVWSRKASGKTRHKDIRDESLRLYGIRGCPACSGKSAIKADRPRTERCDLKQATRHHHVLEEMDHLIPVGKIAVERRTRDHTEHSECKRHRPNPVAGEQQQSAAQFKDDRHEVGERRHRQAGGGNHRGRRTVSGELAEAAHDERQANQHSANDGKIAVHGVRSFAAAVSDDIMVILLCRNGRGRAHQWSGSCLTESIDRRSLFHERTPSSIGIETRSRELLDIRQAETVGANSKLPCLRRRPDPGLFDVTKLSHARISDRAPGVDRFRCHWERARHSRIHLSEFLHSEAVLERHAVRFQEIEEHTGRGWMPARSEHDRHVVLLHPVLRLSDIVNLGNHEVQVMNNPLRTLAYSDAVMERTGKRPHEGHYLSNAVGFPEVQHVTEEGDRFGFLRHRPYDMAETLDLGVGGRERLARTWAIGREEFQSGAGMRLHGTRHPCRLAEIALRGAKLFIWHIGLAKPAMKQLELRAVLQLPADALEPCRLLLMQDDGAGILVIATKHYRPVRSLAHKLQTNDVLVELARFLEVADVQLNVSEFPI